MKSVTVKTEQYKFAHGKNPRGYGTWVFEIGCETFWMTGKYAEAVAAARRYAASHNVGVVIVGP